jgi:hypothetical protein
MRRCAAAGRHPRPLARYERLARRPARRLRHATRSRHPAPLPGPAHRGRERHPARRARPQPGEPADQLRRPGAGDRRRAPPAGPGGLLTLYRGRRRRQDARSPWRPPAGCSARTPTACGSPTCARVTDPRLVADTVAAALGLDPAAGSDRCAPW